MNKLCLCVMAWVLAGCPKPTTRPHDPTTVSEQRTEKLGRCDDCSADCTEPHAKECEAKGGMFQSNPSSGEEHAPCDLSCIFKTAHP